MCGGGGGGGGGGGVGVVEWYGHLLRSVTGWGGGGGGRGCLKMVQIKYYLIAGPMGISKYLSYRIVSFIRVIFPFLEKLHQEKDTFQHVKTDLENLLAEIQGLDD